VYEIHSTNLLHEVINYRIYFSRAFPKFSVGTVLRMCISMSSFLAFLHRYNSI